MRPSGWPVSVGEPSWRECARLKSGTKLARGSGGSSSHARAPWQRLGGPTRAWPALAASWRARISGSRARQAIGRGVARWLRRRPVWIARRPRAAIHQHQAARITVTRGGMRAALAAPWLSYCISGRCGWAGRAGDTWPVLMSQLARRRARRQQATGASMRPAASRAAI